MAHAFDPGYQEEPFRSLVADYPGPDVYPPADFRTEWGPIFHRGRLDGSARVLLLGQDPATHETVTRRILVGEAGQRIQGFLTRLGIDTSYVFINTFVYSVYGQGGGERHIADPLIADYRNRWIDAILTHNPGLEAVVSLGHLAGTAYKAWKASPGHAAHPHAYAALLHPTYPESASRSGAITKAAAMQKLCDSWNAALTNLRPKVTPDTPRALKPYGSKIEDADLTTIPEADLPPGFPDWMRSLESWARRGTGIPNEPAGHKRAVLLVEIPTAARTWP